MRIRLRPDADQAVVRAHAAPSSVGDCHRLVRMLRTSHANAAGLTARCAPDAPWRLKNPSDSDPVRDSYARGNGLFRHLLNEALTHFGSRAKKADAFLGCRDPCSGLGPDFPAWMRICSSVSGLLPGKTAPFCSAANCLSQRRTALSPTC